MAYNLQLIKDMKITAPLILLPRRSTMRKTIIPLCLLFMLFSPLNSWGAIKNVTITWSMSDAGNVSGYTMYYSYSSTMANRLLACTTTDGAATSLTCSNLDLTSSPVYFVIAASTPQGESTSPVSSQSFSTGISVVRGFTMELNNSQSPPPPAPTVVYKINFQPDNVEVPAGYQMDNGRTFSTATGYGWETGPSGAGTRDRDDAVSPDQRYDTMIHVNPTSIWEMTVPNGNYSVTICNGDASFAQGIQNVQAEGVTVIDNVEISATTPWVEKTANVTVSDSKLSVTFAGSTNPARLCWLTISSTP